MPTFSVAWGLYVQGGRVLATAASRRENGERWQGTGGGRYHRLVVLAIRGVVPLPETSRMVPVASPPDNPRTPRQALPGEDRLLRSAQKGDRNAFAALVEHYWDRLFRWLYHLTHDRHTAEDLAQETFLRAFGALNRFQAGTNFGAWIFRIAHNALANQRRGTRRREPLPPDCPGREADPVDQALDREAMRELARAVGKVPAELRAAFLLRVEEGLSFREIADVLGLTEETARWRVFKARQRLVNLLAAHLEREKS